MSFRNIGHVETSFPQYQRGCHAQYCAIQAMAALPGRADCNVSHRKERKEKKKKE